MAIDSLKKKLPGWKDMPLGGVVIHAGNAVEYKTGTWRTFKPVWDEKKCVHCLACWLYCPDASVIVKEGKFVAFDYDHCKGCGICAKVCPPKVSAIKMEKQ